MATAGRPRVFGSDPPTGSGRARGSLHCVIKPFLYRPVAQRDRADDFDFLYIEDIG